MTNKNSTQILEIINQRYKDLKHKEFDFRSFQNGFIECFFSFCKDENSIPKTYSEALFLAAKLARENEEKDKQIKQMQSEFKAKKCNPNKNITYTVNQIASGLNITSQALNKWLYKQGIQYKQSNVWHLYRDYKNKGYAIVSIKNKSLLWTEKGKNFILALHKTKTGFKFDFKQSKSNENNSYYSLCSNCGKSFIPNHKGQKCCCADCTRELSIKKQNR